MICREFSDRCVPWSRAQGLRVAGLSALAVACLAFTTPALAKERQLRLERVELSAPFPSQRTDLVATRLLEDEIRIGDAVFAVRPTGKGLKVALEPGTEPKKSLGARGGVVTLRVPTGEAPRNVRVGVSPRVGGGWEWAVVEGRALEVDHVTVHVVDVDGDGRFVVGTDGCRYPPSPLVLPLREQLVVGRHAVGIVSLAADGERLTARVEPLAGSRHQLDGLVVINELRVRSGLLPVVIDPETSKACSDHAHYLLKTKWRPGKVNPHGEVRGFPGFTEAGHRAGQRSVIAWSDHGDGARAYWDTYYHRFPLAHPATATLGVSDGTPSISVIDGRSGTAWGEDAAKGWKDPVLVPADGERVVGTNFHRGGESPEPVARAASCGYPLTVQFLSRKAGVSDFRARLVSIDKKGREEEIALLEPDGRRSANRFGAIPERPLRSGMTYRVTYTFFRDGEPGEVSATFRTY